jgi:hypothetical protein
MTQEEYDAHFREMVLEGVVCGLQTPQEWVLSYSRCIGKSYTESDNIQLFCDQVSKEFCLLDSCGSINKIEDVTTEDIDRWFKKDLNKMIKVLKGRIKND